MSESPILNTARYRARINEVFSELIPVGSDVALFDFPNYSNVGDSMIWLGQDRYLRETAKARVVAVKDFGNERIRFPKLDPSVIILFQGGGNTGDIWPHFQELREQVVSLYPRNRIIQMPQSIHFDDESGFERTRRVYGSHEDFHFLARDTRSLDLVPRLLDRDGHLCPDMALFLEPMPRIGDASVEIVGLLRDDKEKNPSTRAESNPSWMDVRDWIREDVSLSMRLAEKIRGIQNRLASNSRLLFGIKRSLYNHIARQRLERGIRTLSDGKVVITDRLHAHVLCCLLGIPHVVLDNSYGKIFALMDTWHTGESLAEKAENMFEAREKAATLLARSL